MAKRKGYVCPVCGGSMKRSASGVLTCSKCGHVSAGW